MLVIALREHDLRLRERLRGARSAIALGIAIPVVAALPEIFRLASFSNFKAFSPSGTGPTVGFGNLRQPLNPLEAFGVWPSGEFRITPANSTTPEIAFYLGALLALVAFAWGLGRALSRRESALPSALLAATLLYLASLAVGTPYTQAKALAIAAPLIMVIALRGLLSADSLPGEEARRAGGGRGGLVAAETAASSRPASRCRCSRSRSRQPRPSRHCCRCGNPRSAPITTSRRCCACGRSSTARTCSSSAATTSSPGS